MRKVLNYFFLTFSLVLISACSFSDVLVDKVATHNGLVDRMDAIIDSEELFYNAYVEIEEGDDLQPLSLALIDFKADVSDLDVYMSSTNFASEQEVFVEEYNSSYKPFLDEYLEYAGEFELALEEQGVLFDVMEPFFVNLDAYTRDFLDIHNSFSSLINTQADEVVE